jgi:hypothetical protein
MRRHIQRRADFDIPADRRPRYADAKFDNFEHDKCEKSHPFCVDDQDLFIDGKYQLPAPSKMEASALFEIEPGLLSKNEPPLF